MARSFTGHASTIAATLISVTLLAGCATMDCKKIPITVAKKEERLRTEMRTVGMRTTPTGGVEEVKQQETVREHWVQDNDGSWHKITEEQFEVAAPNVMLEVCR